MNIDVAHFPPYLWILAAALAIFIVVVVIRFFWQHILKHVLQGCLVIIGILGLWAVLHYFFKIF